MSRMDIDDGKDAGSGGIDPIDPEVSCYPQPMSARRARFEAGRANYYRMRLPKGHPYAVAPRWLPYPLARIIGRLHRLF